LLAFGKYPPPQARYTRLPLHPDTVTALFLKHVAAAGLPRMRLHDLRHSYATAALKSRTSPKIISERLGHTVVAFTLQTYTHVIPGMDQAAANEIANLILGPLTVADNVEDAREANRDAGGDE